jgi:DNA-binding GntR family transcriptional regulator
MPTIVNNSSVKPFPADAQQSETGQMTMLATIGLTSQEVEIFQQIHRAIFEQRLLPATRLTEEELAEVFGVSRMRVRRVLLALAHTGMIALPRGRGAVVASPTPEEARAVFAARRLIESALLEQAEPLEQAVIARLKRMIAAEEEALHAGDRAASIHLSGAFHIELARLCANPVVAEIVAGLVTRSSLVIALFQRSGHVCCRADDHGLLVEALGRSDHAGAIELMRVHLTNIESGLDLAIRSTGTRNLRDILSSA